MKVVIRCLFIIKCIIYLGQPAAMTSSLRNAATVRVMPDIDSTIPPTSPSHINFHIVKTAPNAADITHYLKSAQFSVTKYGQEPKKQSILLTVKIIFANWLKTIKSLSYF